MGIFIAKGVEQKESIDYIPNNLVANLILSLLGIPVSANADGLSILYKIIGKTIKREAMYMFRWKILKRMIGIRSSRMN